MEEMIKRILEIDTKARDMTTKAEQMKAYAELHISEKKASLKEDYLNQAQNRIQKIEEIERENANINFNKKSARHTALLEKLNKQYNLEKDKWVDMIVQSVIEG